MSRLARYAVALLACVATTLLAAALRAYLDAANTVMLFLLAVALTAVYLGRGAGVVAAVCSVALFDFFFVPPRFSFTVADVQYLVTFSVMLAVALIISHLAGGLRRQAFDAEERERTMHALYRLAKLLAGAASSEQVAAMMQSWARETLGADALLLTGSERSALTAAIGSASAPAWLLERAAAAVASDGQSVATDQLGDERCWMLVPLRTPARSYGVLALWTDHPAADALRRRRAMLDAVGSAVTATLERLFYVELAQSAQMRATTERLRSSILSAISHDVRTPLTVLYGLADKLVAIGASLPAAGREAVVAIRDQSRRLSAMVSNLLDMARLQAGDLKLRSEWQPLEEIVGASIQSLGGALAEHRVEVSLPTDLPLLQFDAVLIERVLANLLENAAKYSPRGSVIAIDAAVSGAFVEITVSDRGLGFPPERLDEMFELFARGAPESAVPGMGMGLAISQAIVEAHGGRIRACNREGGGASVIFTLPRGEPPPIDSEAAPNPGEAHAHP